MQHQATNLFAQPAEEAHWKISAQTQYNLLLEVKNKQNSVGFVGFQITLQGPNDPMTCILYVIKIQLHSIK